MRMIVAFEKTAQVRHIGHLDMQRAMQRALRRSALPIRYSQGFNPHALLSFASPLPVGVSGAEELFEVGVEDAATEALFALSLPRALPASLPLVGARLVEDGHPKLMAVLKTASYTARFDADDAARAMAAAIPALLARGEIIAIRKSKSGEKPCDIRPMIFELSASEASSCYERQNPDAKNAPMLARGEDGEIALRFRVSLTERETLKPDLLLRTLAGQAGVELPAYRLCRERLFGEKDGQAVPLMEL